MRHYVFLTIICVASGLLLSGCCGACKTETPGVVVYSDMADAPSGKIEDGKRVIKMTAERFQFRPSVITVNEDDEVRLEITSLDRTHGFSLEEFDIDEKIEGGETKVVKFKADEAGIFEFHCNVFCGIGHGNMKGQLIVEPEE